MKLDLTQGNVFEKKVREILMGLSPISLAFKRCRNEKRPALLTYTVAGDPNKKKSLEILKSISENTDILELGFPHSTPIADGGQFHSSAYRAIKN